MIQEIQFSDSAWAARIAWQTWADRFPSVAVLKEISRLSSNSMDLVGSWVRSAVALIRTGQPPTRNVED